MASVRFGVNEASVRRAAENLRDRAADDLTDLARRSGEQMEEAVREFAGFYSSAPDLFDNVVATVEQEADGPRVYISPDYGALTEGEAIHIAVIENGRRGYFVRPVAARKLRWWDDAGTKRFADEVYIPAQEGFGIMRRARDRVYQRMRRGTV